VRAYHWHSRTHSSVYYTWNHMKNRCTNPNAADYKYYGGRGIKVCDRWMNSFPDFLTDMGNKPTRYHTLERINKDGNYEPSNCKWATMKEQSRNKSNARILELNGIKKSTIEWAEFLGINVKTIRSRLNYGWPVERVLTK